MMTFKTQLSINGPDCYASYSHNDGIEIHQIDVHGCTMTPFLQPHVIEYVRAECGKHWYDQQRLNLRTQHKIQSLKKPSVKLGFVEAVSKYPESDLFFVDMEHYIDGISPSTAAENNREHHNSGDASDAAIMRLIMRNESYSPGFREGIAMGFED